MKQQITITTVALATLLGAAAVQADGRDRFYDHARVLSVQPIVETVEIVTPRQQCWDERVYRSSYRSNRGSTTGIIFGTILGGAIGNTMGKGHGKDVMTVAGALLGASIGNDLTRYGSRDHDSRRGSVSRIERQCRTVEEVHEETRTVAYRVKYRYQGHNYWSRMDQHPGNQVRVRVQVSLAE